jgi:hypothetical protein
MYCGSKWSQPPFPYMITESQHPKITKKAQGQYLELVNEFIAVD